jgi:branched-chain amino acid transport system ATP-binding protein
MPDPLDDALRLEEVSAAYKKLRVIVGVSLAAKRGEAVALIGPNGAGKSTLLRIIAGFLKPSEGRVLLGGRDVNDLPTHERARLGVGYLMQGGRVFPSLTVAESLVIAANSLAPAERAESIRRTIELLDLRLAPGTRVGLLSGGLRHYLALGMVLVGRPSVLLLDEPSAGLSPLLTQRIFEALDNYRRANGAAILLTEQNLQAALSFAQRAIVLDNGRISAETERPAKWLAGDVLGILFKGEEPETSSAA